MSDITELEEVALEEEVVLEEEVFPQKFKGVCGKEVSVIGSVDTKKPILGLYKLANIQGNVLLNDNAIDGNTLLDSVKQMLDNDFLCDESGTELGSIMLPIDAVNIADKYKGVIVDSDLRRYTNNFDRIISTQSTGDECSESIPDALNSILSFIKTLQHMKNKGFYFNKLDGHQLFFNSEYGTFRYVYDGVDVASNAELNGANDNWDAVEASVPAIILHLLTGEWPAGYSNPFLGVEDSGEGISFDEENDELDCSEVAEKVLRALPIHLRNMLFSVCLMKDKKAVTFAECEQILNDAMSEIDECCWCGSKIFTSASNCLCCNNTTSKKDLFTKLSVYSETDDYNIRFSLRRGSVLMGEILGVNCNSAPLFRIMYNPTHNSLGLKNMSTFKWIKEVDGIGQEILPGSVTTIEKEMKVHFHGIKGRVMHFCGYEN